MVTHRDLRFEDRMDAKISEIMTPAERLITIKEGATLDDAKKLMHEHRLERVLVKFFQQIKSVNIIYYC